MWSLVYLPFIVALFFYCCVFGIYSCPKFLLEIQQFIAWVLIQHISWCESHLSKVGKKNSCDAFREHLCLSLQSSIFSSHLD